MLEIIQAIFRPEVLGPMIPIIGIGGGLYYSYSIRKLKIKSQSLDSEDIKMLHHVLQESQEVNNRLENLEAIITSLDKELLSLKASNDAELNQQKVKEISEQVSKN